MVALADVGHPPTRPTSSKNTVAAAQATAGIALSSDGQSVFFAEYASNTTGFDTCANGQTGNPNYLHAGGAGPWPCMLDPIAAGSTGSGHGRGMSQWGTQYWARGTSYNGTLSVKRLWQCIVDHYYNANSNSITVDPTGTGSPGVGTLERVAFMYGHPTYGSIAYQDASTSPTSIRVASAADGSSDSLLVAQGVAPSWAPGGARLVYQTSASKGLSIVNADGTGITPISSNSGIDPVGNPEYDFNPKWSPLGDKIAFCSTRSGSVDVWTINPDGTELTQVSNGLFDYGMGTGPQPCYLMWSADAKKVSYTGDTVTGPYPNYVYNVYTMTLGGSGITQITNCGGSPNGWQVVCDDPSWSPDGTKLAFEDDDYQGDNIGGGGLYLFLLNATAAPYTIPILQSATIKVLQPHWTTDGQRVIYLGQSSIWSVYSDGSALIELTGAAKGYKYSPQSVDCTRCERFDHI